MPRSPRLDIGFGLDITFGLAIGLAIVLAGFLSVAPANAQNVLSPSSSDTVMGKPVPSAAAPSSARPTADPVKDYQYQRSPADRLVDEQNAKLDKVMKGICRGC
jgi:hypothetical protein